MATALLCDAPHAHGDETDYEQLYRLAVEADLRGKAQTVLGTVAPGTLGYTLMHEHLFVDFFPDFPWPQRAQATPPALFRKW